MTHSLKVAQIGRRIAQKLVAGENFDAGLGEHGKSLPDIVETAGLAHDIGHPPFGHTAEEILADKMAKFGGFEGNAQSFRVITKLAVHQKVDLGLDLTRASLDAVLKYPRFKDEATWVKLSTPWNDRSRGSKWGAYRSEQEEFDFARDSEHAGVRCPAAVLMDWADDISYATHDLYDYFRAGLMPLNTLPTQPEDRFIEFARSRQRNYAEFDHDKFDSAYRELAREMPAESWLDRRSDRVDLDRLMSTLISQFFDALVITNGRVEIDEGAEYRIEVLKQLTFFYVIRRPSLAMVQEGQRKIIEGLFDDLASILSCRHRGGGKDGDVPVPFLLDDIYDGMMAHEKVSGFKRSDDERRARAVCDYICALTEDQAINLYERITGLNVAQLSVFGAWIV
jgi:dGTPase